MFTAAKQLLRVTNIWTLNLLLYGGLIILTLAFRHELNWALIHLPKYQVGYIESAPETMFYSEAAYDLEHGESSPKQLRLLKRSLAIDPNSEARFWLGEYYFRKGKLEAARIELEKYIKMDPNMGQAYLRLAEIHLKQGQKNRAQDILRKGIQYYESRNDLMKPRHYKYTEWRFNRKARKIHSKMQKDLAVLRQRLASAKYK